MEILNGVNTDLWGFFAGTAVSLIAELFVTLLRSLDAVQVQRQPTSQVYEEAI